MQTKGALALVTGANCATGKVFAEALLEHGAAKDLRRSARHRGARDADARLVPVQLDVTDAGRVAAVVCELGDLQRRPLHEEPLAARS
jgi:NAD(P)-dependent dehydrogenase (short-subunit alcohol dehydrogenase family)